MCSIPSIAEGKREGKEERKRGREMAQWVGALLCSHDVLSLNLRHQCKKSDVATDVCSLPIVGQRQLDSVAPNRELPIYGRPCLKAVRKVTEDS